MIALRASRNVGSGGEMRSPWVMTASATADPTALRTSHNVSAQISPTSWTSWRPVMGSMCVVLKSP
jgi:hypothetical protein